MLHPQDYSAKKWLGIALLVFIIAYYFAPSAPFYLDDYTSITENSVFVKGASPADIISHYGMRSVSYLSLWFDFERYGYDAAREFRWTNLVLHALMSLAVYFLLSRVLQRSLETRPARATASLLAILYLVHPLNIQSVTYVVQRIAALAAFFGTVSVLAFYLFRTVERFKALWLLLALLTLGLAVFSKQNALVLPLLWYAVERFVVRPHSPWKSDLIGLAFVGIVTSIVVIMFWPRIDALTTETSTVSRLEYFLAQGPILWIYAFKFFVPINLHLEYGLNAQSFPLWLSIIAWLGHLATVIAALRLLTKQPLVTFAVAWFYIAHSIESSVIPIRDFAFEHRTYLPNVGLLFLIAPLVQKMVTSKSRWPVFIPLLFIVAFTAQSAYRNYQWADKGRFYAHELKFNPSNYRVLNEIAINAANNGDYQQASEMYEKLIVEHGSRDEAVLINAIMVQTELENWPSVRSLEMLIEPRARSFHPSYRARFYLNRGIRLKETGNCRAALPWFERVQQAFPGEFESVLHLTQCHLELGNYSRVKLSMPFLIKSKPNDARVRRLQSALQNAEN